MGAWARLLRKKSVAVWDGVATNNLGTGGRGACKLATSCVEASSRSTEELSPSVHGSLSKPRRTETEYRTHK